MKPEYKSALINELEELREKSPIKFEILQLDNLRKLNDLRLNIEEIKSPLVLVYSEYKYITDNSVQEYITIDSNQKKISNKIDIQNAMLANQNFQIIIVSKDLTETVTIEDYLIEKYQTVHTLEISHPFKSADRILINVKIDTKKAIDRCNIEIFSGMLYQSILFLECDNCVYFSEDYHPGIVAFDAVLQLQILKRIGALYDLSDFYLDQLPYPMAIKKDPEYIPSEKDLNNQDKSNMCKAIAEKLRQNSEVISIEYGDICSVKTILQIMEDQGCDLKKATEIFDQKKEDYRSQYQKRIEKKEKKKAKDFHRNQMFLSQGDKVINEYTDAVVNDLKTKIHPGFEVSVFGGSSYQEFARAFYEKQVLNSTVVVRANMEFTFDYKTYSVERLDGTSAGYFYDAFSLPILYGVTVEIYSVDEKEMDYLAQQLKEAYSNEVQIKLPIKKISNSNNIIRLSLDPGIETKKEQSIEGYENLKKTIIAFQKFPNVYYIQNYEKKEVEDNQRLQFRMVQQCLFLQKCLEMIKWKTLPTLEKDYRYFTLGKKPFFSSVEFNEMRNRLMQGLPIERELFDKAFEDITTIYPMLYDKMFQKLSVEQIKKEIEMLQKNYDNRLKQYCSFLELNSLQAATEWMPIRNSISSSPRDKKCFEFYEEKMENSDILIFDAITKCRGMLWEEELEARERDRAREEARAMREEESESSGGGSFLGSMVGAAVGTAIGNKKAKKQKKGKVDLWGTAACPYGNRIDRYRKVECNSSCPKRGQCSRA